MTLPYADECAKVRITYRDADNNVAVNLLHIKDEYGNFTEARCQVAAEAVQDWINAHWDTVAVDDWECIKIEVQGLNSGAQAYYSLSMNTFGAVTGNPLPNQVTLALSLRTGYAGRSYRGRAYHVGLAESMVSVNDVIAPYNATIPTAWFNLKGLIAAEDMRWIVLSYYSGGAVRDTPLPSEITDVILVDNIVDTQRRRLPRG